MRTTLVMLLAAVTLAAITPQSAHALEAKQAVYTNLADSLQGSLDDLTNSLRSEFAANGWDVVVVHEVATDRNACPYHARVLVLNDPRYAQAVLAHGPLAAFAVPVRVLLYQDEAGTHLAMVNPHSINRTIVAETGFEHASENLVRDVTRIAAGAVRGRFAPRAYGQVRERGLIGRTMGIMAGGPFTEKIKTVWSMPGNTPRDVATVAGRVWSGLDRGGSRGKWQMRGIYRFDLPEQGVSVIGVSGDVMETKSYAIVGAGSDDRRSHFRCAGLAHAAAYPIEIVVYHDQQNVHVAVIDGMYRMKMYFEDAGKMKFAANMGMPGSLEDEIRGGILAGVGAKP
jgi:uncharacterized protein (DUF302 family)